MINREAKPGVDGVTAEDYLKNARQNLRRVFTEIHREIWWPRPVRKAPIPKGPGEKRILGVPCVEDKIVQWTMVFRLEPRLEAVFLPCSYGFRPRVGTIDACKKIRDNLAAWQGAWIVDADIRKFFDSINHKMLMGILKEMGIPRFYRRLTFRFLKAGVQDGRQWEATSQGTPQGGVISPLLANAFLHVVLDIWFAKHVLPNTKGRTDLIRYADDFVVMFEDEGEARACLTAVTHRLKAFDLDIHPEKTRIINCHQLNPDRASSDTATGEDTALNFLGFTLYMAPGRGQSSVRITTSPISIARSVARWAAMGLPGGTLHEYDAERLLGKIRNSVGGFLLYQSHLSDFEGHLRYLEAVRPVLEALMRRAKATSDHHVRDLRRMLSAENVQALIDEARQRGHWHQCYYGDWRFYWRDRKSVV